MVLRWTRRCGIPENAVRKGEATSVGLVGNCADLNSGTGEARRGAGRFADGPDERARSIGAIRAEWETLMRRWSAEEESRRVQEALDAAMAHTSRGCWIAEAGRVTLIREQHSNVCVRTGRENATTFRDLCRRTSGHLLEGKGPFRWRRFSGKLRTSADGSTGAGTFSAERAVGALDQAGAEAREISGAAIADLLAGVRRARQVGLALTIW